MLHVIRSYGTPFEAMTGRPAYIDGLLAEVFSGFTQL
jgi:hypothetical protein